MNNLYILETVVKLEHEERMRRLAPIPDFFKPVNANPPGWVSRQARRLLSGLENGLAGLRRFHRGSFRPWPP